MDSRDNALVEALNPLRTRNNRIEALISSLKPDPENESSYRRWEEAMTLAGEQFYAISKLYPQPLGSTRTA